MESVKDFIKILNSINLNKMINTIMKDLHEEIIELNQVEQLSEGVDARDVRIITKAAEFQRTGKPYSQRSINERLAEGLQVDNVDLKITGRFWKTFRVVKVKDGWQVRANFNVHGDDIRLNFDSDYDFTGLTPNNLEVLVYTYVLPRLEKMIKQHLKL